MHCRILRPGHFPSTGVEQIGWASPAFSFRASCLGCTEGVGHQLLRSTSLAIFIAEIAWSQPA